MSKKLYSFRSQQNNMSKQIVLKVVKPFICCFSAGKP